MHEQGTNNTPDPYNNSDFQACFQAIDNKDIKRFTHLLEKGLVDIDALNEKGETLLHYALLKRSLIIVELLLKKGAKVNRKNQKGQTPLYYTTLKELEPDVFIVNALLKADADGNIPDENDQTPLYNAIINGKDQLAELIIKSLIVMETAKPSFLNKPECEYFEKYYDNKKLAYDSEKKKLKKEPIGEMDGKSVRLYDLMNSEEMASKFVDSPENIDHFNNNTLIYKEKYPWTYEKFLKVFLKHIIFKEKPIPPFVKGGKFQDLRNYVNRTEVRYCKEKKNLEQEVIGWITKTKEGPSGQKLSIRKEVVLLEFMNDLKIAEICLNSKKIRDTMTKNAPIYKENFPVSWESIKQRFNYMRIKVDSKRVLISLMPYETAKTTVEHLDHQTQRSVVNSRTYQTSPELPDVKPLEIGDRKHGTKKKII